MRNLRRGVRWSFLIVSLFCAALAGCKSVEKPPAPPQHVFYPYPPDPPRVQFLAAINTARGIIPLKKRGFFDFILGAAPDILETPKAWLDRPYGVGVWRQRIYICDGGSNNVKVIDLERKKFYMLGGEPSPITAPTNFCVAPDGYKFVVESMPALIQVFDPEDKYVTTFKVKEGRPGGVAAVGTELFVTDVTGNRIQVLERSTGKLIRTFGSTGKEPGQFLMPNAIVADAEGNLYVSDLLNFRFQKVDRDGKSLIASGGAGDTYGKFARPRGIAVGPDGVVFVVESYFNVVQMFDQAGKTLMAFGNFQGAPGYVLLPASIAVDKSCLAYFDQFVDKRFEPEYLLFVTSQVGDALLGVYAYGHLKPGAEIPPMIVAPPETAPGEKGPAQTKPPEAKPPETKPAPAGTR